MRPSVGWRRFWRHHMSYMQQPTVDVRDAKVTDFFDIAIDMRGRDPGHAVPTLSPATLPNTTALS